jgi:hypothetical protein
MQDDYKLVFTRPLDFCDLAQFGLLLVKLFADEASRNRTDRAANESAFPGMI